VPQIIKKIQQKHVQNVTYILIGNMNVEGTIYGTGINAEIAR
jgi:hypothetical protein